MKSDVQAKARDGHIVHGTLWAIEDQRGIALLVHGITADRHEWGFFDFLQEELANVGFSSLAIDYRGHGRSDIPISRLSLAGVILDIEAAWGLCQTHIRNDSSRQVIVGNSFGGGVSLFFGSRLWKVNQVVGTCPVMSYVDDIARVNESWQEVTETGLIKYASKHIPASLIPEMHLLDLLLEQDCRNSNLSIFHGSADSDVPLEASEQFLAARGSGQLFVLDGMDHSFSAPAGTPDADSVSKRFRREAAIKVAEHIRGVD